MSSKFTVPLSEQQKETLVAIANKFKIFRGEDPSMSGLIKQIADKEMWICPSLSPTQQYALIQCLVAIKEMGKGEIVDLLLPWLKSLEFEDIMQESLKSLENKSEWVSEIEKAIAKKQPFKISYKGIEGDEQYTCVYAHLQVIERHRYLVAKVTEAHENLEHENLAYNRYFRLDRILATQKIEANWEKLGYLEIQFLLYGNWTKRYEIKENDTGKEWVVMPGTSEEPILKVTRKIWSIFWFLREIERYDRVKIISPKVVQDIFLEQLKNKLELYNN